MVRDDVQYLVRMEPGIQTPDETLARGRARAATPRGFWCRCCATSGIAARFVSGYLIQLAADVKSLDGPSGPEKDFTDLHAWAEAYFPAPDGSASTRPRACSPARATSRSRAPRCRRAPRP
jgi:transglutaminase-like putative cysteine protease